MQHTYKKMQQFLFFYYSVNLTTFLMMMYMKSLCENVNITPKQLILDNLS